MRGVIEFLKSYMKNADANVPPRHSCAPTGARARPRASAVAENSNRVGGKALSLVARAPPRLENTSGAAQKISESAARVLLLRNAFGVRTYTEKDDDHN